MTTRLYHPEAHEHYCPNCGDVFLVCGPGNGNLSANQQRLVDLLIDASNAGELLEWEKAWSVERYLVDVDAAYCQVNERGLSALDLLPCGSCC